MNINLNMLGVSTFKTYNSKDDLPNEISEYLPLEEVLTRLLKLDARHDF